MTDFDELLEELKQKRDELRLQMHLASKEIKDEWEDLEEKMEDFAGKAKKFSDDAKLKETGTGIGEALEAGCWGVGIARYSNYMDINSLEEADAMDPADFERRVEKSRQILRSGGPHYVIDEPSELIDVVADVNARLACGERP